MKTKDSHKLLGKLKQDPDPCIELEWSCMAILNGIYCDYYKLNVYCKYNDYLHQHFRAKDTKDLVSKIYAKYKTCNDAIGFTRFLKHKKIRYDEDYVDYDW